MIPLQYFLAAIISYLGLIVGNILIFMAPEELKPGKKVFIFLRMILGLSMFIILLTYYLGDPIVFAGIILLLILIFALYWKNIMSEYYEYVILSIIFFLSYTNQTLFIIESLLIFIFGLPTASLYTNYKKKKESIVRSLHYSYFIVLVSIMYLLL